MNTLDSIEFAQRLSEWAVLEAQKIVVRYFYFVAAGNTAELRDAIADALVEAYAAGVKRELP